MACLTIHYKHEGMDSEDREELADIVVMDIQQITRVISFYSKQRIGISTEGNGKIGMASKKNFKEDLAKIISWYKARSRNMIITVLNKIEEDSYLIQSIELEN